MDKKTATTVIPLTILMTVMEMTGLPSSLFVKIHIADINPIYFTLMINFIIAMLICWAWKRFINKRWAFGLQSKGLLAGLRRHGIPAIIATVIVVVSFVVGLSPFDNSPTIGRVLIEGFIYYTGVGVIEELYLRGLLQNFIEQCFGKRKNAPLYAVLITSVLFGLGHIFGALSLPIITIVAKVFWATALGVYFGAVYCCTRNLWVPIVLHTVIDFCGVPFCFTTSTNYPYIALIACLVSYLGLACYGISIILKSKSTEQRL